MDITEAPKADHLAADACPRCGTFRMDPVQARNALSRKDNKTYVCSSCGTDEASINIRQGRDADVWPGFPGIAAHYRLDWPQCSYCSDPAEFVGDGQDGDLYCGHHKAKALGTVSLVVLD